MTSLGINAEKRRGLHNERVRRKVGGGVVIDKYLNKITCGDCYELIKKLPDKSVDCIYTDPPMNFIVELVKAECLRIEI